MSKPETNIPSQLGDFEIHTLLGAGGSGQVFEATWGPRKVALKILRSDLLPNDAERTRFYSEAQRLADLGHPGIVKILSYGSFDDGRPYLAMELLEGVPLASLVTDGPLPFEQAIRLFSQIAQATAAIHKHGLIHRDLKPENIVVASNNFAVLLDFGIAKSLDAPASTTTQEGGVRGTPAYMAPERFFGQAASIASDIYELSVLLYVMVTGQLPWSSTFDPEARLNPKRPSEVGAKISHQLETVIMRGLSTRPEARPASVGELLEQVTSASGAIDAEPQTKKPAQHRYTMPLSGDGSATPRHQTNAAGAGHVSKQSAPSAGPEAFAPTLHSTNSTHKRKLRSLWPIWLAAGVAMVSVGVAVAFWDRGQSPEDSSELDGAEEPVGFAGAAARRESPEPLTPTDPQTESTTDLVVSNRVGDDSLLDAVTTLHPRDTTLLMAFRLRELRQSTAFSKLITDQKELEPLATLTRATQACGIDVIEDLDWVSLGTGPSKNQDFDIIVSGNFTRDTLETCLANVGSSMGAGSKLRRDGDITLIEDGDGPSAFAWISANTVMVSTRKSADAVWLRKRIAREDSMEGSKVGRTTLAGVNRKATIWLAGRTDTISDTREVEGIAVPSRLVASIVVGDAVRLDSTLIYPDGKVAKAAAKAIDSNFDKARSDALMGGLLEALTVTQKKSDVVVEIAIGKTGTEMLAGAIGAALAARK